MARFWSSTIILKGEFGGFPGGLQGATVSDVFSQGSHQEVVNLIDSLSSAAYVEDRLTIQNFIDTPLPPDVGSNVDRVAIIVLQREDTGATVRVAIPSPLETILYATPSGVRVLPDVVANVAVTLSTWTNRTYTGRYGFVRQKR